MAELNVADGRCEALFASALQRTDTPSLEAVEAAINSAVSRLGLDGCTGQVAQEFGDHPEAACERMRWARDVLGLVS